MSKKLSLLLVAMLLVAAVAGCASTTTKTVTVTDTVNVTNSSTVTSTSTSTLVYTVTLAPTPTQSTGTPATTAGSLAALGANLYEADCTFTYCHSSFINNPNSGGGFDAQPAAVSFSKSSLSFFDDAANLFVFVKSFMHQSDTKLFLTDDQYVQIVAYLLVQNGTLQDSSVFGLGNLATVKLLP